MKKKLFCALCLFAASVHYPYQVAWAEAYGSGWYGETQFQVGREGNIGRSYKSEDRVSDTVSTISFGGGHSRKMDSTRQLVMSGYLAYSHHQDYTDLDSLATSLELQFIHQPKAGFDALWYDLSVNATRLDYRDSDAREGYLYQIKASLNQRLSARTTGHIGYHYAEFDSTGKSKVVNVDNDVFDAITNEIYLGADYALTRGVYVYAEYGYQQGDFTSSVSGINNGNTKYAAKSVDSVFETCTPAWCRNRYAYRSDGDTQRADLGLAFALRGVNFDLSGRYYEAKGNGNTTYRNWLMQLGAIWNF